MKKMQAMRWVGLAWCVMTMAACEPMVERRGHIEDSSMKEFVHLGSTTKDEVLREFGSPSSVSSFGDETWYYIQARKEAVAFLKPEITDQHVLQVTFDDTGVVSAVDEYGLKDKKAIVAVEQVTPTEGHSLGFFEQVLGNLGRFNKPRDIVPPGRP